ncbi:MAG: GNAT family N-acetyltransferase [Pedobacter sp.]|nr:MAG: GNAT family N-acetyltransferase [Pedobacter sp.]
MNTINITKVLVGQITELQQISTQTFLSAFSEVNNSEDMQTYIDSSFSIEKLHEELCNENSQFYFAMLNNKVIGYLKLNTRDAQTEIKDSEGLEIERIYVLPEFIGQKIGQLLFDKAMEVAKTTDVSYVWLGVWEHNTRAIKFYERNNFKVFDKHVFMLGSDKQTDLMMKKILAAN